MIQRRLTMMLTAALALLGPAATHAQAPGYPAPPYPTPDHRGYPGQPSQEYPRAPQPGYPLPPEERGYPPEERGYPPYEGYQRDRPAPYGRGWGGAPWEAQTRLRVVPPPRATVTIYDGRAIVGQLDRRGALALAPGRPYRVVARRGRAVLWSGYVTPTPPALDLRWDAQRGEFLSYALPPLIDPARQQGLIAALEGAWSDADRLAIVRWEAARYSFLSSQVDAILAHIERERPRVRALALLAPRIVDPERSARLLRRFEREAPRRRAAELLGFW